MTQPPLSLLPRDWPAIDREAWLDAQKPAGFLDPVKPASGWSAARRDIVEEGYGHWVAFLQRHGILDSSCPPGDRATEDRLRVFITELKSRVAPSSAAMITGALLRMLQVMEPNRDWSKLRQAYNHLKFAATPVRDKLSRMVPAADLLALGIRLMDTCDKVRVTRVQRATRYRDGLLIAVLASCPVRLRNLSMIEIGKHLSFEGLSYRLEFSSKETKAGRRYVANLPEQLTPYIDHYLKDYRPVPLSLAKGERRLAASDAFWIDRMGQSLSSGAIRQQINERTKAAFGKSIWPHLFRDCAVTELVDEAPHEIGVAPDLLGHGSIGTTQKHYIKAKGMTAHHRVQEVIAAARRNAARAAERK